MRITSENIITKKTVITGKPGEHLDCTALASVNQGKGRRAFVVRPGGHLILKGFATIAVPRWVSLVGIFGGKVEIHGGRMTDRGGLVHGDFGTGCMVRDVKHEVRLWKYGQYLGDWYTAGNGDLNGVDVNGYDAPHGSEWEAVLRVMGANGSLKNLTLDNTSNTMKKEALQLRHGTIKVADSTIRGSISIGRLNPNAAEGKPYAKYRGPSVNVTNTDSFGHVLLKGDATLSAHGLEFLSKDARGNSPSIAITAESFAGYPVAVARLVACTRGPFKKLI